MHIALQFRQNDFQEIVSLIDASPFANLVTTGSHGPEVNHLPLIRQGDTQGNLRLIGHFAKGNPAGQALEGQPVLAVFQGPSAYISPTWYDMQNAVPTWNYLAVHVTGTARIVSDPQQAMAHLTAMVDRFERTQPAPWTMEQTEPGFIEQLLAGIIPFEITPTAVNAQWKLSQHHDAPRRARTAAALRQAGGPDQIAIADWMNRTQK